ncbi:DUF4365 domain-containing protein [Agrobacterium tumefaciens]|nr:DUF4365 domain-containing protein [Agrobacterium tumefaciens]NTE22222.1 DUF4365 domain-containing protein [Agrobacterium tumefaciens]
MTTPNITDNYYKERNGVLKVAMLLNEYGYVFRETSNADIGIDGQVEHINDNGEATGKIIAAQIKSGDSYLIDKVDHFAFYPEQKHRNYWSVFPLPVILFVYYPAEDKIYFTDVRYQLNNPDRKNHYIKIPKTAFLNEITSEQIFETAGNFDIPYYSIDQVFEIMSSTKCNNVTFNMSYLDLFTQGLTNLCRHVYFSMQLAIEIAEYNNSSDFGLGIGFDEHQFLHNYAKFIMSQNLANIDYSDYLIDWRERQLHPSFIAALNPRGIQLLKYIKSIEANYKEHLPATTLIRERTVEMRFNTPDDYMRLEMGKTLSNILSNGK